MPTLKSTAAASFLVLGALVTTACGGSDAQASTTRTTTSTKTSTTVTPTDAETGTRTGAETGTESTPASGAPSVPEGGPGLSIMPGEVTAGVLALYDEGLEMTDDGSGRQLFVFTSVGPGLYQIKGIDSSGQDDPLCWQMPERGQITPSAIGAGTCDPDDARQHFTVEKSGRDHTFSHGDDGYLAAGQMGMILTHDEPGRFWLVDPNA
ncbi:hypothetical protein [Kineosporia succinea]|uniref:Secreted protein n=1 Tax=Kineosporia succinea TaxID=84632 RepID=A0ABT9PDP5_9ACTN|nr:hypothetical protein [Kineosporia succinea]MDP9830826.1 hypothetical protein [Kineosporia succinea]